MYREVLAAFDGALLAWLMIAGPDMIMTGLERSPTPSAECICCEFFGKYTLLTECVALSSSLVVGARKGCTLCF